MIRVATIFLCMLLAAAALGRYRAEVSVRETRKQISAFETGKVEEFRRIQVLRAEVAYLENPERLARIADAKTDLRMSVREQTLSARQFAVALGEESLVDDEVVPAPDKDVILNAIAMAQIADAQ